MKNFIVRTITGIIFVAAIVSCFLNPIAMVVLFALVTGLTVWEFTGIVNEHVAATTLNRIICTVAGVWFFLAMFGFCWGIVNSAVFLVYLFTIMYLVISELYLKHENPINNWAYTMLSQMYIAMPLSLINVLAFMGSADGEVHYNYVLPLSVFVFLWVNDSGAYCCGSLLGRHKLFPRVSPGKSWEGSIGGAVLVVVVAARPSPHLSGWALDWWWSSSAPGATWWKVSSNALWASRIVVISCQDMAECSTVSTRRSWLSPQLLSICMHFSK